MQKSLILLGLCPLSASAQSNAAKLTVSRPNIVFILADDMGYGDLNCYGNLHIKTPNIDQLSATGMRFSQCYAGSGISSPSRCALMTGKHTGHTTIRDNFCTAGGIEGKKSTTTIRRMNILPTDTTIATLLHDAGYRTCLVNKWHLDGFNPEATPLNRGFDEFYGWLISTECSNAPYYYPYWRFENKKLKHIKENKDGRHVRHNTDISTDDAIRFVERNQTRPFFLYLAYDAPHEPYIIDDTHWYDSLNWVDNTKRYAALVTHMDSAIGRLLDKLNELGLRENTLVIFASDNGAAIQAPLKELNCNASLRGRKGQLYEGGIRVPFIVNQPGTVPAGEVDNVIYFPDIMPTLATLAGAKVPAWTDGMNILPLFYGGEANTSTRMIYWEFPGKQRAARQGDWKAVTIKGFDSPLELYNIHDDPAEQHNMASEKPEMVQYFDKAMKAMRTESANWPTKQK